MCFSVIISSKTFPCVFRLVCTLIVSERNKDKISSGAQWTQQNGTRTFQPKKLMRTKLESTCKNSGTFEGKKFHQKKVIYLSLAPSHSIVSRHRYLKEKGGDLQISKQILKINHFSRFDVFECFKSFIQVHRSWSVRALGQLNNATNINNLALKGCAVTLSFLQLHAWYIRVVWISPAGCQRWRKALK